MAGRPKLFGTRVAVLYLLLFADFASLVAERRRGNQCARPLKATRWRGHGTQS